MYSELVLDHFRRPRHAGRLDRPDGTGRAENPGCGDVVEVSVRVEGGAVAAVGFLAQGCVPAVAAASRLTELAWGAPLEDALRIDREALAAALGGLPLASRHAAQLAVDALRDALAAVR